MKKTLGEQAGVVFGYGLGLFTGAVSFLRQARMFHPLGHLYSISVTPLHPEFRAPASAFARLSASIWRTERSFDALGVAIRLSAFSEPTLRPRMGDQDLLFASFSSPWLTPLAPLLSRAHSYFENQFFTISPMEMQGKKYEFKLIPRFKGVNLPGNREEELRNYVNEGKAIFCILRRKWKRGEWEKLAEFKLRSPLELDQEKLCFDPFLSGWEIYPRGFVHHLRVGAYRFSQKARLFVALKEKNEGLVFPGGQKGKENASPFSPPYHNPLA